MNLDRVEKIAEAVLYRGLHAVSLSCVSVKQPATLELWGSLPAGLCRVAEVAARPGRCRPNAFCQGDRRAQLQVKIHFLQIVKRSIGRIAHAS